jgi:hypothetical protein
MIFYGLPHTANEQDPTDQLGALTEAARLGSGESQKNASRRRPRRLCAVLRHRLLAAAAGERAGFFVAEGDIEGTEPGSQKVCFVCGTDGSNPPPSSGESTANLPPQWPRSNLHGNASSCRSGSRTSKVSFSKPDRAARGDNECSLSDRRPAPLGMHCVEGCVPDSRHKASCTGRAAWTMYHRVRGSPRIRRHRGL